jgi:amino acid permease
MTSPHAGRRNTPIWLTIALLVLGTLMVVVGVVYLRSTADALPSFFPGHQSGSTHKHVKHGVVALILAVASLTGAWISSGRKTH